MPALSAWRAIDAGRRLWGWYEMEELAVMGIVEVLGRLRRLLHIRADLTRRFTELKPDVFVG